MRLARYAPRSRMTWHHHAETSLSIVLSGRYVERRRGHETEHAAGHLLLCRAFEEHEQLFSSHGAYKILITPSASALELLDAASCWNAIAPIHSPRVAAVGAQLLWELKNKDEFSDLVLDGLTGELLAVLGRCGRRLGAPSDAKMAAALAYIEAHACEGLTISQVADAVDDDPWRISAAFRKRFGKTIGACAREARLAAAFDQLANSRTPIAAVAGECGFHDQAHLTRCFRAAYGITPGRFRSTLQ